jgi:hypothetical protein
LAIGRYRVAGAIHDVKLIFFGEMHELGIAFGIDILELHVHGKATYTINDARLQIRRIAQLAVGTKTGVGAAHAVHPIAGTERFAGPRKALDDDFLGNAHGSV